MRRLQLLCVRLGFMFMLFIGVGNPCNAGVILTADRTSAVVGEQVTFTLSGDFSGFGGLIILAGDIGFQNFELISFRLPTSIENAAILITDPSLLAVLGDYSAPELNGPGIGVLEIILKALNPGIGGLTLSGTYDNTSDNPDFDPDLAPGDPGYIPPLSIDTQTFAASVNVSITPSSSSDIPEGNISITFLIGLMLLFTIASRRRRQ